MNVRGYLSHHLDRALRGCLGANAPARVQPASKPEFGDYQANGIMAAAKRHDRNPRQLAEEVVRAATDAGLMADLEVAGPGFINITLRPDFLTQLLADASTLIEQTAAPHTVVVDYSSPNLAKEMHVWHLRSTIIGDAVARVLMALGHTVIRQNHVGDWGTQFGMLLTYMIEVGANSSELADLESFYRASKLRFDDDPEFAQASRQAVVQLQSGDSETREHWQRFIEISMSHCRAIYDRLGVLLEPQDIRAESDYNDMLSGVIESLDEQGLLTESQGALCVFLDEFTGKDDKPLPVIVKKSDGGYLYASTDLAALRYRAETLHADRIVYVHDARQALHFRQVFAVARVAGFVSESVSLEHHAFGTVLGDDGKPFKTRDGGGVKLTDLLDEAEHRAYDLVSEKNSDLDEAARSEVAHAVGIGAVKYADLSKNRTSDYVFDWDQMLNFDGNTAPYLQYAYARLMSMFRRGNLNVESLTGAPAISEPEERALAVLLVRLQEVVEQVAEDGLPHYLCGYLFDVATALSRFYEACPVLSADERVRTSRLQLCQRTALTLREGLMLLGIETVERM